MTIEDFFLCTIISIVMTPGILFNFKSDFHFCNNTDVFLLY